LRTSFRKAGLPGVFTPAAEKADTSKQAKKKILREIDGVDWTPLAGGTADDLGDACSDAGASALGRLGATSQNLSGFPARR